MSDEIVGDLVEVEGLLGYPGCIIRELPDYVEIWREQTMLFRMSYKTMVRLLHATLLTSVDTAHLVGYLVHDGEIDPLVTRDVDDPHQYIEASEVRRYIIRSERGEVVLS